MARKQVVDILPPYINGGRVVFSRSVQPAQYESKKAEVELTFIIPEGNDPADTSMLDQAMALAQAKALEAVGLKKVPQVAAPVQKPAQEAPAEPAKVAPVEAEKPPATKEQAAAAMNAREGKPVVVMPAISSGGERVSPEDEEDPDLMSAAETVEITDAVMKHACSERNAAIKAPQKIKAVIAEFVKFPKGCADIPQNQRQAFLDKLKELKG
jgi:hypothetical protein